MAKTKFPCMLSHKFNPKRIESYPVAVEPKLDGVRALVVIRTVGDEYEIVTYSRAGNPFTSVVAVEDALLDIYAETGWKHDVVLDGELFCGDFKTTVSQIKKQKEQAADAVFTVFDIIPESEWREKSALDFNARREQVYEFFRAADPKITNVARSKAVLANNEDEIHDLYTKAREIGHEGVIVKQLHGDHSHWMPKRSYAWMKLKAEETLDLPIVGAEIGQGKFSDTLGYLVVKHGEVEVGVGTGLTDDDRRHLWELHQAGKLAGMTAEVAYQEQTPDGSLRHPVFKHLRIDK